MLTPPEPVLLRTSGFRDDFSCRKNSERPFPPSHPNTRSRKRWTACQGNRTNPTETGCGREFWEWSTDMTGGAWRPSNAACLSGRPEPGPSRDLDGWSGSRASSVLCGVLSASRCFYLMFRVLSDVKAVSCNTHTHSRKHTLHHAFHMSSNKSY